MQQMHLAGADLNLAVVLHALLEERSVSRAARRLGLSQSATSHALGRLRDLLGDPLFVRTREGLVPTARAEAMQDGVTTGLAHLEAALFSVGAFDPGTARRTFRIGSSDYVEHVLFPPLLARLAKVAPGMDLWSVMRPADAKIALASGDLDLILQPTDASEALAGLETKELWDDVFVGVVRKGHPLLRGKLTLDRFVQADHAFIAPGGRPGGGVVDEALARAGRARRIAFMTPSFLVAPRVVAETDLVITLASRVATSFARSLPLQLFAPPLELAGFRIGMCWHERREGDPAHCFLREEIVRVVQELPAIPPRSGARKRARAHDP